MKLSKYILIFFLLFSAKEANAIVHHHNGFESGSYYTDLSSLTGTGAFVSSTTKAGNYSLRINPTGTGTGYVRPSPFSVASSTTGYYGSTGSGLFNIATMYVSFYFRQDLLPTVSSEPMMAFVNTSNNYKSRIFINPDGTLTLRDTAGNPVATTSTSISAATWYFIEVKMGTGATGAYEIKINGVSEISGTGSFTSNNRWFEFGKGTNFNGNSVNFYYDEFAMDDTDYVNSTYQIKKCEPDADGTYSQWTGGTAPSNYTNLLGTGYIQSTANNDINTVSFQTMSNCGVSGEIKAIFFSSSIADATSGSDAWQGISISGSVTATTSSRTDSTTNYIRAIGWYFRNDPNTRTAWTTGGADAVEFGYIEVAPSAVRMRQNATSFQVLYIPSVTPSSGTTDNYLLNFD